MTRQLSHSSSSLPDGGLVLLIDDEEVIREIGCEMLSSLGMPCVVAENGEEGIALYERNRDKIVLVILDTVRSTWRLVFSNRNWTILCPSHSS